MAPVTARLPRVEAVLGGRVDDLTVDHLEGAVTTGVQEAGDLEFKQADYAKDKNEELAKDVAAMANATGGLILVGIQEQDLRAVALSPVPLSGDVAQRYRQVLAGRVTPMVRDVDIRVLQAAPGDPGHGYVLVAVPRSLAAPHAVWQPADKLRKMSFPVRNGADTRYLEETELAEYYRRRFAGATAQADRLTAVRREGHTRLGTPLLWLTAALVPALPGEVPRADRLDRARTLTRTWAGDHPWQPGDQRVPTLLARSSVRVTAGVRRAVLGVGKGGYHPEQLHVELHDDGAGYAAVPIGLRPPTEEPPADGPAAVSLWTLTLECRWLVSLLTAHALAAGSGGEARIAVELARLPIDRAVVLVGPDVSFGPDPVEGGYALMKDSLPGPVEAEAIVDLEALAAGPAAIGRVAAQLAEDLVAAFGLEDLGLLDREGLIRLRSPIHPSQQYRDLYEWAERHGVLADPGAARA
jgi:Putative DNA-binding domain